MPSQVVNVRMDSELKKDLEVTCHELGMSVSTAFIIFAKKLARERRMPFEVSVDPFYSEANMKRLRQSIAHAEAGKYTYHDIIEVKDEESLD